MIEKYQGFLRSASSDGASISQTYQGSKSEMQELFDSHYDNEFTEYGRLKHRELSQDEGNLWICKFEYESIQGDYSEAPDYSFGKKSASLRGSLLSLDLSTATGYLTNWNYALYIAPGCKTPAFWKTAKTTELSEADAQNYIWGKVGEEHSDQRGKWRCITPTMPGVESIDYATYSITESARFSNQNAAGKFCAAKLNKIGFPEITFGIKGGNWKCDDASVSWTGEYWLATLTWTRSGGNKGWNTKLYELEE